MVKRMKGPVVYTDDDKIVELPCRWEICCRCNGHGTDRGASVECDGGGFTSEEWAEQDEDFRADYLAGVYDRPCAACDGTGKVQVVDEDRCKPELLAAYRQQIADDAEIDAIYAAERRMGA